MDNDGVRLGIEPAPAKWNRDSLGRLWTISDSHERVLHTFLWDGFACIGRIDGPPGAPLAAVFSLDPSRTPVRILSPERVVTVARDLYGEALLTMSGVPGLHGAAIHRGFAHLRSRVLDPRCGSYDRPDPYHGRDDDPRRKEGFRGPLSVESAVTGPYAVCQYDGITFTDPTGESTGLLLLSDFTWSFVHNIAGWFGLDWTLNFWLSLFSGRPKEFFEFETFHSDRTHAYGTRRGGLVADIFGTQARTYHHQIWVQAEGFDELSDGFVFDPGGVFEPVLYGSLLRGVPQKGSFLLQGNLDTIPTLGSGSAFSPPPWPWGRAGGTAKAVVPGLPVPRFPSGGLHFTTPLRGVRGLQDCKMTELVPVSMPPVSATVSQSSLVINVASIPAGLAVNDEVMLSDAGGVADIKIVTSLTRPDAAPGIRFADTQQTVAGTGIELRGLSAPSAPDTLTPGGPVNGLLTNSSTLPFVSGDPLRLTQNNVALGAAIINRLETHLNIDGALPTTFTADIDVRAAILSGTDVTVTLTGNALTGSPLPNPGDFISLTGSGITIGALVGGTAAAPTVDREAADLTPLGASVKWRSLTQSSSLGKAAGRDPGATLTYAPLAPRTAPTTGFLILVGAAASVSTARFVKSADYDAIALNTKLPGDPTKKFQVERFTFEAPDLTDLTIDTLQGLTLPNDTPLPGVALQLNILGGPKVVAGATISQANLAAGVATYPVPPAPAIGPVVGPTPVPSQLVVLTDAANNIEAAVVSIIKVTLRFDRAVPAQLPDIRLVALGPGGPAYPAAMNADGTLTASANVGGTVVQMPRFNVGEIVEVAGGGLATPKLFSVSAVSGCTLTLTGDTAIAGTPAGLTVQRMVPIAAPGPAGALASPVNAKNNGTPWAGLSGALAGVATDAIFQMWRPDDATRIQQCCLVSSDPTNPATPSVVTPLRFLNVLNVSINFTTPPAKVSGTITITDPNPTVFYAASFAQSGVDLTIAGVLPAAIPPSNNLIVAVPYGPGSPEISAAGSLGPGTVLCPDDPVNWEFDRRHSLAEHELTHSLQPARHGQVYWGIWPLFAYEGVMELLTDVEIPKQFSAFVSGKIERVNETRVMRIPDPQGVTFEKGTRVQVFNDSQAQDSVKLSEPAEGGGFVIDSKFSIRDGDVQVRTQDNGGAGTFVFRDVLYNLFRLTSLGGLMNISGAAVYGGLVYGIGGLINGVRMIFSSNTTYPAKVDTDGLTVHMTDDAGKVAMQGVGEIVIHFGDKSDSRKLASIANDTLKLTQTTDLHGAVQVAVKNKFGDIWDWHTYYTATVPDPKVPARIKVQPRDGGDTLTLKQFDRVTIGAGTSFFRTNVVAVTAEGLVDLEDAPLASSRAGFRIALVDHNDPIRSIDDRILTEMGPGTVKLGWLRIVYDPFEQIDYRFDREKNSVWDIVARVARYGWSTHSWSWAIPGTLFLMNLFIQAKTNSLGEAQGHLSPFEQEASGNSGNLYSPVGRIFGGFSSSGFGAYNAVAGDVARYWHTLFQGVTSCSANNEWLPSTAINAFNRDSPGVNMQKLLRVVPNVSGTPGSPEPNGTVAPANVAVAGTFVPDLLIAKSFATPAATAAAGPTGFSPSDLGLIPTTPKLNQSMGCYLAFTQPGTHRITIQDVTSNARIGRQGREAQAGSSQTLWFDITVSDVGLKVAGQDVAAVPPSPVSLVVLQQATVSVTPEDGGTTVCAHSGADPEPLLLRRRSSWPLALWWVTMFWRSAAYIPLPRERHPTLDRSMLRF